MFLDSSAFLCSKRQWKGEKKIFAARAIGGRFSPPYSLSRPAKFLPGVQRILCWSAKTVEIGLQLLRKFYSTSALFNILHVWIQIIFWPMAACILMLKILLSWWYCVVSVTPQLESLLISQFNILHFNAILFINNK